MSIYQENGYLDMAKIINYKYRNIFVYGGRGPGKTFNSLAYVLQEKIPFLYLRRTQSQIETLCLEQFNPFKEINRIYGYDARLERLGKYAAVVKVGEDEVVGYGASLSTFANIRSFSAEEIQIIIYDEFVPEKHQKRIPHEYEALMNLYESINRNRELTGAPAVKLIGLTNSNDITSPILLGMQLISTVERMKQKGLETCPSPDGETLLVDTMYSPILGAKAETGFYKTKHDSFSRMAISGDFERLSNSAIKSQPIAEYTPLVTVGEVTIYRHKSRRNQYYCTQHRSGNPDTYGATEIELQRFGRACRWVWNAYFRNAIIFSDQTAEIILTKYLGLV